MSRQRYSTGQFMHHKYLVALALSLASLVAHAQNAIESVTGSIQGGIEVLRIELTQPLREVPKGFTVQSPARVALDFPGVTNAVGRSNVEVNQGNLKSVSIVNAGERTRVVLNLKSAANYRADIQGKSLLVVLSAPITPSNTGAAANVPSFAESRNPVALPIKDIDFRRAADGAGRIVVSLANDQVGVDISQQGKSLVVDFMQSTLPQALRKRLDVTDFGTPVQTVTTVQSGDKVRMVIEPKGQWEQIAYQSDSQFVVEVKEVKADAKKLNPGAGYTGQKLSLNFQSIEVRSLLQVIADFTNFNIITSDSVAGTVTLRLQDVPWDQALDIILQAKSLGMRKNGNVIWIAPKDEIAAKEKLELEALAAVQGIEPLKTQYFQFNYAKAADVAVQLAGNNTSSNGTGTRILSARGSVIGDARTNQLFVTDIPSKLEQIQQLVTKIDMPVRQVLIEAKIVEATNSFGKSLGVRLGGTDQRAAAGGLGGYQVSGDNRVVFGTNYGNVVASSGAGGTGDLSGNFVNMPAIGFNGVNAGTFALSLFGASAARFLNLEISALEADGNGKIVSSPRVITADQTKALIEQGTELPYQVATSSGATSIAFRKANLKLEVTPQITPEGNMILDLDVTKDSVGQSTTAGYAINTKHINTRALVENGGTVVIGGIYEMSETDQENKVPFFGDLPGVGVLFRNKQKTTSKTELLVFITPKLITDK